VLLQHVAESSDLFGLGVEAGRGEQAARHAERAGIERLREHFLHMAKLAFAGRPVLHAHRHQAQHDGIHRYCRPGSHVAGEIRLGKREPRRARRKIVGEEFSLSRQSRRNREAAIPDDLRSNPLPDFRFRERVERQREVGMGMNVDKAGGEHQSGRVDFLHRGFGTPGLDC
jgi:hypothetical protein